MTGVRKDYNFYYNLPVDQYEKELKLWYKSVTGENLDLDHPNHINEKIQWLKLYDSTPLKTKLADKYLVREWIRQKIGGQFLVPLLGVWDSFDEIDFNKLPDRFALKANHGSGWNIIVADKSKFDKKVAKMKFDRWMKKNFAFVYGMELHYMNIPPKIIAEKYIEQMNQVYDYKFMCFNGRIGFIWVDIDRFTDHKRTFFSDKWERLDIVQHCKNAEVDIPKPENFDKMIKIASLLSRDFALARVDFYEVEGKLYFGEITFTSASGVEKISPPEVGYLMGNMCMLPPKSPIPQRKF